MYKTSEYLKAERLARGEEKELAFLYPAYEELEIMEEKLTIKESL